MRGRCFDFFEIRIQNAIGQDIDIGLALLSIPKHARVTDSKRLRAVTGAGAGFLEFAYRCRIHFRFHTLLAVFQRYGGSRFIERSVFVMLFQDFWNWNSRYRQRAWYVIDMLSKSITAVHQIHVFEDGPYSIH
ncbi:hypothetical protein CKO29_11035 [Allochromatium vinosum]|nr:hypothetical protein [Allochromatium vinosum]